MRLIDAEELDVVSFTCPKGMDIDSFIAGMGAVLDRIYEAPTVQETIRCEDCKWFDESEPSGTIEPIEFRCKLIWGQPGPDYNVYLFSDYGRTWSFDENDLIKRGHKNFDTEALKGE